MMQKILKEKVKKSKHNNTILFTWSELLSATKGHWSDVEPLTPNTNGISSIATDTRTLEVNSMFLALRGQRFDGHDFILEAVKNKIRGICAEKLSPKDRHLLQQHSIPCLLVPDTLKALQELAHHHRLRFQHIPVIAITGSTGKTSTKEIIKTILNRHFQDNILATLGNTNNLIGVPLNLLKIKPSHRAVVLELGTNSPGEIKILTDLVRPDVAILTNTGAAHLQGLKTRNGVIKEKSQIFSRLKKSNGAAVIPFTLRSHPLIASKIVNQNVVTFGIEDNADIRVVYEGGNMKHSRFLIYHEALSLPLRLNWKLPGAHQALNAAAAVAMAKLLKISDDTIVKALETCAVAKMRMEVIWKNNMCWINDAYNANPDSMKAFLAWLLTVRSDILNAGTGYVVLGDMFELGEKEDEFHFELLTYLANQLNSHSNQEEAGHRKLTFSEANDIEGSRSENRTRFILLPVGERMRRAANTLGLKSFSDAEEVKTWLAPRLKSGDTVALKGSRGMMLERILPKN